MSDFFYYYYSLNQLISTQKKSDATNYLYDTISTGMAMVMTRRYILHLVKNAIIHSKL